MRVRQALASSAIIAVAAIISTAHALDDINEGELRFLTAPPAEPPHRHSKHLTITRESLKTGWVRNEQCHYNLDRVPAMEIVFGKGKVRGLKVLRAQNIERVWVENNSIQMTNIAADAFVCLASENHILKYDEASGFTLLSGPFMRRFLDGYFPMKVDLIVNYPADLLKFKEVEPLVLNSTARSSPGQIQISALFEGKLTIAMRFTSSRPVALSWQGKN